MGRHGATWGDMGPHGASGLHGCANMETDACADHVADRILRHMDLDWDNHGHGSASQRDGICPYLQRRPSVHDHGTMGLHGCDTWGDGWRGRNATKSKNVRASSRVSHAVCACRGHEERQGRRLPVDESRETADDLCGHLSFEHLSLPRLRVEDALLDGVVLLQQRP